MRVALILTAVFGPLAVMALNIERDLKAAWPQPRVPSTPGSIRGGLRQRNNPLQARDAGSNGGDYDYEDGVSAWFQSVRAPLTSSTTSISHRI